MAALPFLSEKKAARLFALNKEKIGTEGERTLEDERIACLALYLVFFNI
jgi:hypothetical protein